MKNPLSEIKEFVFEDFVWNPAKKELLLHYSLDEKINFTEKFTFNFNFAGNFSPEELENAFFGLWIMAGISYFKTCLPAKIRIKKGGLSKSQADFFTKIYENGLGEFFVVNELDPHDRIHFPVQNPANSYDLPLLAGEGRGEVDKDLSPENSNNTIVPIGGGKDSLVTAKILEKAGVEFSTWHIGNSPVIMDCVKKIHNSKFPLTRGLGGSNLQISRGISPTLLKLNNEGALNGHIPISAILAFLSVITAILTGKKNIAFSNENSANFGNTEYMGKEMNHQYSKSLEFEKDFQKYVAENISPNINYFSFLRPLTELKIAEIFAEICWDDFADKFSSCNRNFHIAPLSRGDKGGKSKWCLACPKCAFVGLILSPFVEKEKFRGIFGDNFFNDDSLSLGERAGVRAKYFAELLGLSGHKPFECVGEIAEAQKAAKLAVSKYPELAKFTDHFPTPDFDKDKFHEHSMPKNFARIWKKHF